MTRPFALISRAWLPGLAILTMCRPGYSGVPAGPFPVPPGGPPALSVSAGWPAYCFEPNEGQAARPVRFLARGSGCTLFLTTEGATLLLRQPEGAWSHDRRGRSAREVPFHSAAGSRWVQLRPVGGRGCPQLTAVAIAAADQGRAIAVDRQGFAYVTGRTESADFPTVFPVSPANRGKSDVFVAKHHPAGGALIYATYLGGDGDDEGRGIAVTDDPRTDDVRAVVTGRTASANFPTRNAHFVQPNLGGGTDAFVAVLSGARGMLEFATFLGGSGDDVGNAVALRPAAGGPGGAPLAYITGQTSSPDLISHGMPALSGTLGGSKDAFVACVPTDGLPHSTPLVYETYLGGGMDDGGNGIAVDAAGRAYVTGTTQAIRAFNGSSDAFIARLRTAVSPPPTLDFLTYLGGMGPDTSTGTSFGESANGLAMFDSNTLFITGETTTSDFPPVNPVQRVLAGAADAFVVRLSLDPRRQGKLRRLPSELSFGTLTSDEATKLPLQVVNEGTGVLMVSFGTPVVPFSVASGGTTVDLDPGQSHMVEIRFAPTAPGQYRAVFTLSGSDGQPLAEVQLVGKGK